MENGRPDLNSHYDLIAIGSGPAGECATELASYFGHRCLVIEKNAPGGTVTTTGGVPTKTLRETALYMTGFRDRDVYGVRIESAPEVMLDAIRRRTWEVSKTLQLMTIKSFKARGIDYLQGRARLQPDRTIQVETPDGGTKLIQAKVILLATGSRPAKLGDHLPANHLGVCDTDTILHRGHPPKALLIVGGGPVAVEFATIARALDINVTIASLGDRLLTMMDGEVTSRLTTCMADWGVTFVPRATVQSAIAKGELLDVTLTNGESVGVDTILFAAGRVGNTEGMGLEALGVKQDEKGRILVDRNFRTSVEGIYAAGDVIEPSLASVAMEQGRRAVCHAFRIPVKEVIDPTPVSAVYSMPEVARAGLTEEECRKRGFDYEVGRADLDQTPRGAIAGRGGLLKLIFLKNSRKLLGVHCIGDIASEVVGIGQMVIKLGGTIHTFASMTMNTPTYSFAYKYAAFDGLSRLARQARPSQGTDMQRRSSGA